MRTSASSFFADGLSPGTASPVAASTVAASTGSASPGTASHVTAATGSASGESTVPATPIRVLFICHGNICRSPMAEFVFKKLVREAGLEHRFEVESAATSAEEIYGGVGRPVYPPAQKELARHGISCAGKQARQVRPEDYARFDHLVVMDDRNVRNLKRLIGPDTQDKVRKLLDFSTGGTPLQAPDISDPWYTGDFARTYADVLEGCQALLALLTR